MKRMVTLVVELPEEGEEGRLIRIGVGTGRTYAIDPQHPISRAFVKDIEAAITADVAKKLAPEPKVNIAVETPR